MEDTSILPPKNYSFFQRWRNPPKPPSRGVHSRRLNPSSPWSPLPPTPKPSLPRSLPPPPAAPAAAASLPPAAAYLASCKTAPCGFGCGVGGCVAGGGGGGGGGGGRRAGSKLRRLVRSMAVAPPPSPVQQLRRWQGSSPPWLSSPFLRTRYLSRPAFAGGGRQDYSPSSGMGVSKTGAFRLGLYGNLNVQSSVQEWVDETKRIIFLRTTNNVRNNISNGTTPLRVGNMRHDPSEDLRSSNYPFLYNLRERGPSNSIVNRHVDTDLAKHRVIYQSAHAVPAPFSVVNNDIKLNMPNSSKVEIPWHDSFPVDSSLPKVSKSETTLVVDKANDIPDKKEHKRIRRKVTPNIPDKASLSSESKNARKVLATIYDKVLVVDNVESARSVVKLLTTKYKGFIHACDTEVANIDVKEETPVGHGEVICFSIYSGNSDGQADFGNGKTCIWVDVLDGGRDVLMEFAPFFEDPSIKKVWHNYSFDSHVIENCGIKVAGFHADTMHLARLWDSSRRIDGGYSLEGLTNDHRVMNAVLKDLPKTGKMSMKTIFGWKKVRKNGSEGKTISIEPVEKLQREDRELWICYSSLDSMSTLKLYESLKNKLEAKEWIFDGCPRGTMYDFYEEYWRPFGALLVKMETEGMLVDRAYLSEIEKAAIAERELAADKFRKWASNYCPDAKYMNVNSDTQIRQLFFGGIENRNKPGENWPQSKTFKVPHDENMATEGKKTPKSRTIKLFSIVEDLKIDMFTPSGWPSVSGEALRSLAGKIPTDHIYKIDDDQEFNEDGSSLKLPEQDIEDTSPYGTAYEAFGRGKKGREACHAIAALCEICSIDKLISSFIIPLQGDHISCKEGRIHCSLNINTETGRLSARTPNLQNQPALEKDRYKIRQAFVAAPGNTLIVADYGQLELRILAHLTNCKSMLEAFKAGGDFHSRTAMNMYQHVHDAVEEKKVLLEWHPQPGHEKPPVPLLKDAFGAERRKAKMLNFSIAYGKTAVGLSRDWKVSVREARDTLKLWYRDRKEVSAWQKKQKAFALEKCEVYTLLGRSRQFPNMTHAGPGQKGHVERAAINAPVQGSAADVAMCAMLEIERNARLKELGWRLLLQVHDEVILEGPTESAEVAKAIVVECMSKPFYGTNILKVDLAVDANYAKSWYAAK